MSMESPRNSPGRIQYSTNTTCCTILTQFLMLISIVLILILILIIILIWFLFLIQILVLILIGI